MVQNIEKIAFIHDWFSKRYYGGAEKTAEILNNLITKNYVNPDLFALFEDLSKKKNSWIYNKKVTTSFIQNLPFSDRFLQYYLPLFPLAIEQLDLGKYDLSIKNYIKSLKLDPNNKETKINLIKSLTFFKPKDHLDNEIIKLDLSLYNLILHFSFSKILDNST